MHHRLYMGPSKQDRRGERQHALRLGLLARKTPLRHIEIGEHAPARLEIGPARLRQREPPCSPGDEPHVEIVLEPERDAAPRAPPRVRVSDGLGDGPADL